MKKTGCGLFTIYVYRKKAVGTFCFYIPGYMIPLLALFLTFSFLYKKWLNTAYKSSEKRETEEYFSEEMPEEVIEEKQPKVGAKK